MHKGRTWWIATVLAGVGLSLVAAEAILVLSNQASASRLAMRRAFIEQTPQLARVTQIVASAIAGPATSDATLKAVLTRNDFALETRPPLSQASK